MSTLRHSAPKTKAPHFATLLLMVLAPEEVGARIREARDAKGWTHEQLARRMDVNWRTVQRWQKGVDKNGKATLPRLGKLMELADVLDVPRSYFVETAQPEGDGFRALAGRLDEVAKVGSENQALLSELVRLLQADREPSQPDAG